MRKAVRSYIWLGTLLVVLVALIGSGVIWSTATWVPKLGLDLQGGTEIILSPQLPAGETPTAEQLNQAVNIIRQRVDGSGVAEADINTQGGRNVVVSIPGKVDDQTRNTIKSSAKLEFRAVLYTNAAARNALNQSGATSSSSPAPSAAASPSPSPNTDIPVGTAAPTGPSDLNWVSPELKAQYDAFDCSSLEGRITADNPDTPLVTCDTQGQVKYLLGPVDRLDGKANGTLLDGQTLTNATAGLEQTSTGATTNTWVVNIAFNGDGKTIFGDVTGRISQLQPPQNQFAIVLDHHVIEAPSVAPTVGAITGGTASISGSFTQQSAQSLANQLKYGALPISFTVQSEGTISATLGTDQLRSGLIAGMIGLLLVIAYSLFQYRLLGLVTVASLAIAATLTYLLVTFMSWNQGYRLSLAGVAGLIVAIGITADSFIVYFERIRDELREGRGLESAVENGWSRALRTIIASDSVNFLAAIVLYVLSVGSVRGFAFTLGLTTIIDLVVVCLFTHPTMRLLARTKFFGEGHRFSGLNPKMLGATYRGRGSFAVAGSVSVQQKSRSAGEALKRQTIAERKAQAAAKSAHTEGGDK